MTNIEWDDIEKSQAETGEANAKQLLAKLRGANDAGPENGWVSD